MRQMYISLDDVKGIFKALISEKYNSIFETRTLNFLRAMHELYGVEVYLFCTYKDGKFSLENVSDRYMEEFRKNLYWLKFGFHCYQEKSLYSKSDEVDFLYYFDRFYEQIRRITGQEKVVDALRIHGFWGNETICKYLRENGVTSLFTADDDRKSYYLNQEAEEILRNKGIFYDVKQDLKFIRSVTRLENSVDIIAEVKGKQNAGWSTISLFTHEWLMDNEEVRKKFELCCQLERK